MANTPTAIKNFQTGFRLISGDDLNTLVSLLNSSIYLNAGAPTNGTSGTGHGITPKGALIIDTTNGGLYQNTNTLASPTWALFEAGGSSGAFTTLTASGAVSFDTTALVKGVLTAGVQGTLAGEIDLNSPSTAKGKLIVKAADNTGATNTTITNAAMGQASVITLPDPGGATGTFALLEAAQTFSGAKTFNANPVLGTGIRIDLDSAPATLTTNAVTLTKYAGVITSESLTTAAGASQAFVITKVGTAAGDLAMVTAAGGTNTRQNFRYGAVTTTDTITVTVYNNEPTNALNGTLIFNLIVFKA